MLSSETNATSITIISLGSLFLALSMVTTYLPSLALNVIGLVFTSFFIFYNTLRKNDLFAFVMVMYFCSFFPYLPIKGGAFNLVGFVVVLLSLIARKNLPGEIPVKDKWFKLLIAVFVLSSVLGWFTNYTGTGIDLVYSVITFLGVVFLFLVASRIIVTEERIRIFIQINMVLIVYSTITSLNKYLKIITFNLPMLPIYGSDRAGYFEGGGIIGSSPIYGEYSMILAILFTVVLVIGYNLYRIRKFYLILFIILSFINIFMSISRSVLMLSFVGVAMIIFLQFKINVVRIQRQLSQIIMIASIGFATIAFIQYTNLDIVFNRMEQMQNVNQSAGGVTIDRIIDGSAFNRDAAFSEGYDKYNSKDTWWIGYGWGLTENNRDAFFVNPNILLGTMHSQFFAILFIFGWFGFIAYFGLILRLIWKSYRTIGNSLFNLNNRITAYFFMIAFVLFILNEIKVDSVSNPGYFAATMLLLGLAYANINSLNFKID